MSERDHEDRPVPENPTTGHPRPQDKHMEENSHEKLDSKLDEALEETFPTSDPVSVKITK